MNNVDWEAVMTAALGIIVFTTLAASAVFGNDVVYLAVAQ